MVSLILVPMLLTPRIADPNLAAATKLWRDCGLPVPPAQSRPASIRYGEGAALGYVDPQGRVYFGSRVFAPGHFGSRLKIVSWKDPVPKDLPPVLLGWNRFLESSRISGTVQAALLGREAYALSIPPSVRNDFNDGGWFGAPVDRTIQAHTAMFIATALINRIVDPSTSLMPSVGWSYVRDKLKVIDRSKLVQKGDWTHSGTVSEVIAAIESTMQQRVSKPGTLQNAVDNLTHCRSADESGDLSYSQDSYVVIVRSYGLDAVPALAKELATLRLTRHFWHGRNLASSQLISTSFIAGQLLLELAKGDLGSASGKLTEELVMKWYRDKTRLKPLRYPSTATSQPVPAR